MAPLRVDMLPGIGHVRRRILLEELNITLVREIAAMDMGNLKLVFGRAAYVIRQRAIGIDPTPVYPPRMKPTVAEEITLPQDENDDEKLLGILYGLVEKCGRRLRNRSMRPRKAGLVLRYADQEEVNRRAKLNPPSFWDVDLYEALESLFFKACKRRIRVRFMRVWFQDFSSSNLQLSLFDTTSSIREKKNAVSRTLDRIREKHGETVIKLGRVT
jgi:DNA polymerase-4